MKAWRSRSFWALLLVWGLVAWVRLRLATMPFERDEGEYAYMGWRLLQGVPPYREAANMKWPGTYAAYALLMALFGVSDAGVRVGLLLVNAATGAVLWRLARRWFDRATALSATLCFAVWSLSPAVLGLIGHATHFVSLFVLLAWDGLGRATSQSAARRRAWTYFASGLALGGAVLFKQHAVLFAFPALLWALRRAKGWNCARDALALTAGALLPIALTFAVIGANGDFGTFWFWTVDYARQYIAATPPALGMRNLVANASDFARDAALWGGALLGFYLLWRRAHPARGWLSLWLLVALATTVPGLFFRPHYFLPALPFLSLLAGHFLAQTGAVLRENGARGQRAAPLALGAALLGVTLFFHRAILLRLSPEAASRALYRGEMFVEARRVGRALRAQSAPGERLAIFGSEPQIAFYARLPLASQFLYTYNLVEPQPFAARMQRQMAAQIERNDPRWVVYVRSDRSWIVWPGSDRFIFDWWQQRRRGFDLVATARGFDPVIKRRTSLEVWRRR